MFVKGLMSVRTNLIMAQRLFPRKNMLTDQICKTCPNLVNYFSLTDNVTIDHINVAIEFKNKAFIKKYSKIVVSDICQLNINENTDPDILAYLIDTEKIGFSLQQLFKKLNYRQRPIQELAFQNSTYQEIQQFLETIPPTEIIQSAISLKIPCDYRLILSKWPFSLKIDLK